MRHLVLAIPALMLASCGQVENGSGNSSSVGSRSFALSDFDQIALRGADDVSVVVGKAFSVSATGPEAELDQLEIEVENGTLKIGRKSNSSWHIGWSRKGEREVKITVTMPTIRGARLAGSGDMTVDKAIAEGFKASVAGSGGLKVGHVEAKSVALNLAGSGDIDIAGKAGSIDISDAGSGSVRAGSLEAETADISLAGSGNINARATGSASVSVLGSGNVEISGTDNCKTSKLGSGSVTCKA
jgi:hypothetical protein